MNSEIQIYINELLNTLEKFDNFSNFNCRQYKKVGMYYLQRIVVYK